MFKDELAVLHQIGLHTGLRLGDCCNLKWASVDLERKLLTVKPRKTARYDRTVSIPLVPELESALKNAARWNDSNGFVLPNTAGRYNHNPCGIQKDYEYILQKAGIQTSLERPGMKSVPFKTFHSLRHTFISRLAEKGVSPLVIQSMSGHTTMAMTERYTHIGMDAKRRALGQEITPEKTPQAMEESATKKKLDGIKLLLESKNDRTPLEEALLALL
jgi:integrase